MIPTLQHLGKAKLWRQQKRSWFPGPREKGEDK